MQVSVEKTSELSRIMTVKVPEEVVQEKMEARFKTLARDVKLDGFRPGKVPAKVVKKMFGDRVRGEVTGDIIQTTYFEALQQEDLTPAGHPQIQPSEAEEGFEYTAEFEVYPEVSLAGLEQIEVARPVAEVTDNDLDKMIEKLREQKKEWLLVERAAQEKDQISIHFSGVSEGENFTNGKVEDFQVEIGAKQMIPGFEDNLIGLEAGAEKVFSVAFPEQYENEKLAGKAAEFEIEVVKVEESTLPEVDAEFIKAYGVADGSMEAFRSDVKENMGRELEQAVKNKIKNTVMDGLYDKVEVPIPNAMIDQEIETLMKPYKEQAEREKVNFEALNLTRDTFEDQAKRRVALGLILAEVIKQNDIKVDGDKVRAVIEQMAQTYEKPEEVINWHYADKSRLTEVEQMVLEDEAVAWLMKQVKVTDESASFDDLINPEKKES
jgi:trigger factor